MNTIFPPNFAKTFFFPARGSASALYLHFIDPLFALPALVCYCLPDPDSAFEVLPIFHF